MSVAVQRLGADAELEAVVLGGIVRAGDLDAAGDAEVVQAPVQRAASARRRCRRRRRRTPSGRDERVAQRLPARPVVAADGDLRRARRAREAAPRSARPIACAASTVRSRRRRRGCRTGGRCRRRLTSSIVWNADGTCGVATRSRSGLLGAERAVSSTRMRGSVARRPAPPRRTRAAAEPTSATRIGNRDHAKMQDRRGAQITTNASAPASRPAARRSLGARPHEHHHARRTGSSRRRSTVVSTSTTASRVCGAGACERRLEHVPLREEARCRRTTGKPEQREHEDRHRDGEPRAHVQSPRSRRSSARAVAAAAERDDDGERAHRRERVGEAGRTATPSPPASVPTAMRDEHEAGVRDARVREHALEVRCASATTLPTTIVIDGEPPDARVPAAVDAPGTPRARRGGTPRTPPPSPPPPCTPVIGVGAPS